MLRSIEESVNKILDLEATIAAQAEEIEWLRASLTEYMSAMKRYEIDVDADAPYEHLAMRIRATTALSPPTEGE